MINRSSFSSLMSKGDKNMYGKKKKKKKKEETRTARTARRPKKRTYG